MSTNSADSHTSMNPAVLNCWTAYEQAYAVERGKGLSHDTAYQYGAMAYRSAIPCICDRASLQEFVACVTHGMVVRVIPNDDGGKLLYAANVAAGFFRQDEQIVRQIAKEVAKQAKLAATNPSSATAAAA